MPPSLAPWLVPSPPWHAPAPASLSSGLGIASADIPIVEVLGAPCSVLEIVAVRGGRYVPLFGTGPSREEALRALANTVRALSNDSDPRAADHALTMAVHPGAGTAPLRAVAQGTRDGSAAAIWTDVILAYVLVLGASDTVREQVARDLTSSAGSSLEVALALCAGGGDFGTYREHYASMTATNQSDAPAIKVLKAWFDFVLARRFHGLDALRALADTPGLDPASHWLIASADLVAGEERARARMAEAADHALAPVNEFVPKLLGIVARKMAEIVSHPMALRFQHLQCAAARDHAAVAIRAWLTAAVGSEPDDHASELGPEPTRAGRAAIEGRIAAGEFLLDWFIPDREARDPVDTFARNSLRVYHRLRGAQILARVEREMRPSGAPSTQWERVVWPHGEKR